MTAPGAAILRSAAADDVPRLVEIEDASFADHRISRARFDRMLRHATRPLVVAETGGRIAGYASVLARRGFPEARLFSIAVDPAFRGRALGARLLAAAEDTARSLGCTSMRLEVDPRNAEAVALYRSRGYAEVRRWDDWYGPGRPALVLRRELRRPLATGPRS